MGQIASEGTSTIFRRANGSLRSAAENAALIREYLKNGRRLSDLAVEVGDNAQTAGILDIVLETVKASPERVFDTSDPVAFLTARAIPPQGGTTYLMNFMASARSNRPEWIAFEVEMAFRVASEVLDRAPVKSKGEPSVNIVRETVPSSDPAPASPRSKPASTANPQQHAAHAHVADAEKRMEESPLDVKKSAGGSFFTGLDGIGNQMKGVPFDLDRKINVNLSTDLPVMLPPPPAVTLPRARHMEWISGAVWHPLVIGFNLPLDGMDPDDMMDLERDMHGNAGAVLSQKGVSPQQNPDLAEKYADLLQRCGTDVGVQTSVDMAKLAMERVLNEILKAFYPRKYELLGALKARLEVQLPLLVAVSGALDIERFYRTDFLQKVRSGDVEDTASQQDDIRGSLSSQAVLDGGVTLKRAMFLHYASGRPLPMALCDSLVEYRYAQAEKLHGRGNTLSLSQCEKQFYKAYDTELIDLSGRSMSIDVAASKPEVSEPEPAPYNMMDDFY